VTDFKWEDIRLQKGVKDTKWHFGVLIIYWGHVVCAMSQKVTSLISDVIGIFS
jgi:hypothetical protein